MSGNKDEHNKLSNQQRIKELKKRRLSKSEKEKKEKEYKLKRSKTAKRKKNLNNNKPKKSVKNKNRFKLKGGAKNVKVNWKKIDANENGDNTSQEEYVPYDNPGNIIKSGHELYEFGKWKDDNKSPNNGNIFESQKSISDITSLSEKNNFLTNKTYMFDHSVSSSAFMPTEYFPRPINSDTDTTPRDPPPKPPPDPTMDSAITTILKTYQSQYQQQMH